MRVVKEDFESSEDRKGKACFLRHLFQLAILSSSWEKEIHLQYTARVIGFRETFVLLKKVRQREKEMRGWKKDAANATTLKVYEQTVQCRFLKTYFAIS